jgi:RNA polymerase sigma factor, sigma-70 family
MTWDIFHEQIFPIRHKLYRFALRITGNTHEAEDVVQEVMEKVWKNAGEQSALVNNWEAWCMTLTKNRSLDKARSRSIRRTSPIEGVVERSNGSATPAQYAEQADLVSKAKKFMDQLPEKQKLVMHLRDIEELTYDEIAETLNISLDQVKVSLHRARKAVREQMLQLTAVPQPT